MEMDGHIVEFIDSGSLRFGYVRKKELRKIQVIDQRGRESSVPVSRVVVVHGATEEADFKTVADEIVERVEACSSQMDVELLWDSVHADIRGFSVSELAEAYFGEASPEAESAIFRELEKDALYFKRNGVTFEPRSDQQVASEQLRISRYKEKDEFRKRVGDLLRKAIRNESTPAEPERSEILDRLEKWFRHKNADEVGRILETITGETRAREVAYDLLVQSGHVKVSEDRFLLVHGIPTVFPSEVIDVCARLAPYSNGSDRVNRRGQPTLSIDDENTLEIDDAVTAFEDAGHTIAGVHIADVSAFVAKDDPTDREAYRRSATIYQPNISVSMFPPYLSTDLASLRKGHPRPTFSIEARFASDGSLISFEIFRSVIEVTDRLSYEDADRALDQGHPTLTRLHGIAQQLQDSRLKLGAQTHRRPEIKVEVHQGDVSVRRIEVDTPARLIVSEMMILANRLSAERAATEGIPIIFRTQEAPETPPPEVEGLSEVIRFELLRKSFKRSRLSLSPAPHSGLGLGAYTQMSSPIRRYADLVTQRQFAAALEGASFPYSKEELLEIITTAETSEIEIRRLEQASTAFWILTFLSREKLDQPLPAVALDRRGSVELIDYLVRGKVSDPKDWQPGDSVSVAIEHISPIRGEIRFRTCP